MGTDRMTGFGGKQAWLAVRDAEPAAVLAALELRDLGEVSWRDGLDVAHLTDDRIAVTPPLPGAGGATWVLAAGRSLLRPDAGIDVAELSRRLGTEVQFFATHRVTETHRWQRAVEGVLVRAFGYVGVTGDVTTWFGDPDAAERAAGLPPALAPAAPDPGTEAVPLESLRPRREEADPREKRQEAPLEELLDQSAALDAELKALLDEAAAVDVTVLVSEQDVLRVAGAWSLDPSRLEGPAPGPLRVGAVGADRREKSGA